ncbi:lipopolysaccharide biosynthesis protein [Streptomyces sulfonofaciens]|uniref:lipopolysaccharide biosynthesis protein n=1 Tax=Streptomyces sulfonofaciens TaxID=68272 RepID=UPI003570B287
MPARARRLVVGRARHARARRWPQWWPLPACAALGLLVGGVYGLVRAPQYTATSYVIAVPGNKADTARALGFAQAYGRVATQVAVLADAPVWARVPVATLRSGVRAETSPDAPMIAITATSSRLDRTADMANAVSRTLIAYAERTRRDTDVRLVPFSRAIDPAAPASASAPLSALVGGCAGGLLGGLALLARPRRRPDPAAPPAVPAPASAADLQGVR